MGCARVIVVATEEQALEKIERQLAQAGFLIPGRVDIALKDRWSVASGAEKVSGKSVAVLDIQRERRYNST